jgi:hypothetical protein
LLSISNIFSLAKGIFFRNNNTQQEGNKKAFGRQKMTRVKYVDKDEIELAKSLETEEWVSDLPKKEKKRYEEYARNSLTNRKGSTSA